MCHYRTGAHKNKPHLGYSCTLYVFDFLSMQTKAVYTRHCMKRPSLYTKLIKFVSATSETGWEIHTSCLTRIAYEYLQEVV